MGRILTSCSLLSKLCLIGLCQIIQISLQRLLYVLSCQHYHSITIRRSYQSRGHILKTSIVRNTAGTWTFNASLWDGSNTTLRQQIGSWLYPISDVTLEVYYVVDCAQFPTQLFIFDNLYLEDGIIGHINPQRQFSGPTGCMQWVDFRKFDPSTSQPSCFISKSCSQFQFVDLSPSACSSIILLNLHIL
jgi:hypothetical protein